MRPSYMLPKNRRLSTKEVDLIFKGGKTLITPFLSFKFILNPDSVPARISFIAPKNIAKLAVKRNLLRRRGYRALAKYMSDFPVGLVGAFVFRKFQEDISIIENEIENTLHKIG